MALRDRKLDGWKFKRQKVIGKFVADFYCRDAKLIVELDGEILDSRDAQIADALRTEFLNAKGYTVIRFRNEEVLHNLLEVLNTIKTNFPAPKIAPKISLLPMLGEAVSPEGAF